VTSHFRLSLFPLMAMKHATRNLVSNSECFSSTFLPTHAYNCSPVTKFRTSILTLCIYESESQKCFFVFVREQREQVVISCNMKFKRTCFAQIKVACFIHTVLVSASSSCERFWTTNPLDSFVLCYVIPVLCFICIYLFVYLRLWWCNETALSSN